MPTGAPLSDHPSCEECGAQKGAALARELLDAIRPDVRVIRCVDTLTGWNTADLLLGIQQTATDLQRPRCHEDDRRSDMAAMLLYVACLAARVPAGEAPVVGAR